MAPAPPPWSEDDPAIEWLMSSSEPAIRFRTLTEVLGRPDDDVQVTQERAAIPTGPKVREIFEAQRPDNGWGAGPRGHKYTGTHHVIGLLRELRLAGDDARLPPAEVC